MQVTSLMATAPGADEFYTGVEYVVACESSCHCQFSGISLFCEKRKLFLILDASRGLRGIIAVCFPYLGLLMSQGRRGETGCTCQFYLRIPDYIFFLFFPPTFLFFLFFFPFLLFVFFLVTSLIT